MTGLEKEVNKIKMFLGFLYFTKVMAYLAISVLVGAASNVIGGILVFFLLYLGTGYIERQIYGYKRALYVVKIMESLKDELDKENKK